MSRFHGLVLLLSVLRLARLCESVTNKWATPSKSADGFFISRANLSLADSNCLLDISRCSLHGITFGLKIRPQLVPVGETKFWINNGAKSPYSGGIFLQQDGGKPARFILGVAAIESTKKTAWIRSPFYLRLGHWTQIAFTWSFRQGLIVSVDDLVFEDSSQGKEVLYVDYLKKRRSPFLRELMVDVPYPGEPKTADPKVKDIVFYQRLDEMQDVKPILGFQLSVFGCIPGTASVFLEQTFEADLAQCRKTFCVDQQVIAMRSGKCRCIKTVEKAESAGVKPCSDMAADAWKLYIVTSRIHPEADEFKMSINLLDAKGKQKSKFAPNEPVVFNVSATSVSKDGVTTHIANPLYVLIEFQPSGEQIYLNALRFNRTWAEEGSYKVHVTVATDLGSPTRMATVVVNKDQLAPAKLKEVTLTGWLTPNKEKSVSLLGYAVAEGAKSCVLKDQVGTPLKKFESSSYVLSASFDTAVTFPGLYRFTLECSNQHSTQKKETVLLIPRPTSQTFDQRDKDAVFMNLQNSQNYGQRLTAVADGSLDLPVTIPAPNKVKVDISKVPDDHFSVMLQLDGKFLSRDFVNMYHEPQVSSSTNSSSGLPNVTYDVRYKIIGRGIYDVNVFDVMLKKNTYMRTKYIMKSVVIPQQYTFNATGAFMLNMRACSGVWCGRTQLRINSDIPVLTARLQASPVLSISKKNFLQLFINEGTSMPIVNCSYVIRVGGVVYHTDQLDNTAGTFGPFYLPLNLRHYGQQAVSVHVENNLGAATANVMVKAGQPLKGFAVAPKKQLEVLVGEDLPFTVTLTEGAPMELSVQLSDGTQLVLPPVNPHDFTERTSLPLFANGAHGTVRQVSLLRSAKFTSHVGSLEVSGPNQPMLLNLKFGRRGFYTLSFAAKNVYNRLRSNLCRVAFVEAAGVPKCQFSLSLAVEDDEDATAIQHEYSKPLIIRPVVTSSCLTSSDVRYQWEIFRKSNSGDQRTVCSMVSAAGLQQISLPEFELPYGSYEIRVRAASDKNMVMTSSKSLAVESVRSQLVAQIKKDPPGDAEKLSSVVIDFSQSGDPDGDASVTYDLLCFLKDDFTGGSGDNYTDFVMKGNSTSTDGGEDAVIRVLDFKGRCFIEQSVITILNTATNRSITFMGSNLGNEDKQLTFRLIVRDSLGRKAAADLNMKLLAASNIADAMKYRLDEMLNTKDQAALLMFVNSASSQLNSTFSNASEVKAVVGKMLNALDRVSGNLTDYSQVSMCTEALESLTEDPGRVTDDSKAKAASSMKNTAGSVKKFITQPLSAINGTATTLVKGMSNVVPQKSFAQAEEQRAAELKKQMEQLKKTEEEAANRTAEQEGAKPLSEDAGAFEMSDIPEGMFDCFTFEEIQERMRFEHPDEIRMDIEDCMNKKKAAMAEKNMKDKNVSSAVLDAGSLTGDVLLKKTDSLAIKSPNMDMQVAKNNGSGNQDLASDFGGSSVPEGAIPGASGAGAQFMALPDSPFTWADGAVSSPVIGLSFSDASGKPMKVQNTPKPISLFIPRKQKPSTVRYFFVTSLGQQTGGQRKMNFHSVTVNPNNTAISLYIRPTDPSDIYIVYAKFMEFPNASYYDYKEIVPRANASKESNDTAEVEELMYTVRLPNAVSAECGKYTFGVALWGSRFTDVVSERNFSYDMATYTSQCSFYNPETQAWENGGVEVGARTTFNRTECVSSHLTSFGGDFYVPPNTIDFNSVFSKFKDLHENAAVFSTVISILCLYIIILIWARYKDRQDVLKWGATHLEDNLPSDTYNYELTVMTGIRGGSGTSSKISFIISGDDGDTGVRNLYDGKRKHLERGSVLNYIMSTENPLGQLTFLRIWHDNSGKGKDRSWYFDQMVVTDLQTGDKFFFLCNRWLAVEEDDGMVERIIPVAGYSDLITFKHLFTNSLTTKMRNDHLWLSVFSRPTRSSFTRVQRVSCCVALLFLTMISNAMFYKSDENPNQKKSVIRIGRISLSTTTLYISVVSTLIVFPPSLIIVTFFRKCKAKQNAITQENQELSKASRKYKWRAIDPNSELFQTPTGGKPKSHTKLWDSLRNILAFHQNQNDEDGMETGEGAAKPKKKKQPFLFPHWCIYFAWIVVFLSVFGSAFFVILYSLEWGQEKANQWLVTFVLSFFQSVIVVQPVKVLMLATFISLILKKPEMEEEEQILDDKLLRPDEELLQKDPVDIQQIQLQRRMATATQAPPDKDSLLRIRDQRLKEIAMEAIIKEMGTYFVFILIIFFLSYQTRSTDSYMLHSTLKSTFFNNFHGMTTYEAFFNYVDKTLMPGLYAPNWYNGKKLTWREALAINDGNYHTIRVGVPRFRQFRVKPNSCTVLKELSHVIHHCRDAYGWTDDDTKPYLPGWVKPASKAAGKKLQKEKNPFVYRSAFDLKGIPYLADLHLYKGGGYVMNFARTRRKTAKLIKEIKEQNWLDVHTRAVMIEFTVYNAPANLFGSVIMTMEFMESGGAHTRTEAKIFRLFSYVGSFGVMVLFTEVVFAIFVLVYLVKEVKQLKQQRMKYFKQFWNILEFATLAISLTAVVMYIFKMILTKLAMSALRTGGGEDADVPVDVPPPKLKPKIGCPRLQPPPVVIPDEEAKVVSGRFVNFGSLAAYDELFAWMVGCVVFIATVKFIKILKFNRRMGLLGSTIQYASKDLKSFSIMFIIYFMAFCHAAYLLFGRHLKSYATFISTAEALLSMALGSFNFYHLQNVHGILGPLFFFSFVNLVTIGLLGMFLTIINDAFAAVKGSADLQSNDYELVDFMWKRFRNLFGCAALHSTSPEDVKEEEEEELPPLTNQEKELILS